MITRRQIRSKVMQAIYAYYGSGQELDETFKIVLGDMKTEVEELETKKKVSGDTDLLRVLYYESIANKEKYDEMIVDKAKNWELDRIATLDRILMHMAICEMVNFEEIPVKVTINEFLELAKTYSTPKSSRFINGILDSLYADLKEQGMIVKKGRGLINESRGKA